MAKVRLHFIAEVEIDTEAWADEYQISKDEVEWDAPSLILDSFNDSLSRLREWGLVTVSNIRNVNPAG